MLRKWGTARDGCGGIAGDEGGDVKSVKGATEVKHFLISIIGGVVNIFFWTPML